MKFRLKAAVIFAIVHFATIFIVSSMGFYESIEATTSPDAVHEHRAQVTENIMKVAGPILVPTSLLFSGLGWKDPSIGSVIFIASFSSIIYGVLFSFAFGLVKRNPGSRNLEFDKP